MVKVSKVLTIALAGLTLATIIPTGSAYAAESDKTTVYPSEFEHTLSFASSTLRDYAIYGDTFAFAYDTKITVLSNNSVGERERNDYTHEAEILYIDYSDDGKLYFKNVSSDSTYLYGAEGGVEQQHEFQDITSSKLDLDKTTFYTLNNDGVLTFWNGGQDTEVGTGFSLMKQYGGSVYAVKDNVPHKIEASSATALSLQYTDYSAAKTIYTGDVAEKLKSSNYVVKTAILEKDCYYTQIDPDAIGETFTPIMTKKTDVKKSCLVLCESGDASIIATKNGMFITSTANLSPYSNSAPPNDWQINANGERLAYAVEDVGVYSAPFMCDSTRIATLKSGAEHYVAVTEKFALDDFMDTVFYRVSYVEDGKVITGFVASKFLTPYSFAAEDKEPVQGGDENPEYGTNVVSVVLAIVIVALVIIAVLYVFLINSKKDRDGGKKKKKEKRQPEENDYEEEE